jgi:hypothetical protein
MLRWALDRLQEASTWRGLVWIATALGFLHNPDQEAAVLAVGMAIAGMIGVFSSD